MWYFLDQIGAYYERGLLKNRGGQRSKMRGFGRKNRSKIEKKGSKRVKKGGQKGGQKGRKIRFPRGVPVVFGISENFSGSLMGILGHSEGSR